MAISDGDKVAIFGDYNLPGLQWIRLDQWHCVVDSSNSAMSRSCTTFLDGMYSNGFEQINDIKNYAGNTLDLVLVNETFWGQFTLEEAVDPLITVDLAHPPLILIMRGCAGIVSTDNEYDLSAFDFKKANYDVLNHRLMQIDWTAVCMCGEIDDSVEKFSRILQQVFTECVPLQRRPVKPPWSCRELRISKRERNTARRRYRTHRTALTRASYKCCSQRYKRLNNFHYRRYARKIERDLKRQPKQFWKFVNSKRKDTGLPSVMHLDNRKANTSEEKCSLLAEFFESVFDNQGAYNTSDALRNVPSNVIDADTFVVTEEDLTKALSKLKMSHQPGPDGVPASVLKKCIASLMVPLLYIYNLSMQQCRFPTLWKASYMFPVHKKDAKNNVRHYRGITSLCACSKLLEMVVSSYLLPRVKHYISPKQHGFFPGRSVTTNLVEFSSLCVRNVGRGKQVDAVYTDLKSAFDRVSHTLLLAKLEKLGASAQLVAWLKSYLCDRKLAVKIGSSVSDWFTNGSGVPQGSNLGPLLFSLFFNDVVLYVGESFCILYADDMKIYVVVEDTSDCVQLQSLLDRLAVWCRANNMSLSVSKCSVISFHRKKRPLVYNYFIDDYELQRMVSVRDLGVILDSQLTFKEHFEEIIKKARRQLGFVSKITKEFRDPYTLKSLFVSLVRPILESSSVVWDPYQTTIIDRIEAVQRKFIRFALRHLPWNDPLNLPPYEARCQLLNIETLEHRRKIAKAMFVAKLLAGELDAPNLLALMDINVPTYTLRSSDFFRLPRRLHDYDMNEPIRSMMSIFNQMYPSFDFNMSSNVFRDNI